MLSGAYFKNSTKRRETKKNVALCFQKYPNPTNINALFIKNKRLHRKSWLEDLAETIPLRVKPMSII